MPTELGQPLQLGTAAMTVYWQHGVLDARAWALVTWYARKRPPGPWYSSHVSFADHAVRANRYAADDGTGMAS